MVGDYTALDNQIVEMVMFAKKNGLKRLVIREDVIEIEFHNKDAVDLGAYDSSGSDCTTYYYTDEETN